MTKTLQTIRISIIAALLAFVAVVGLTPAVTTVPVNAQASLVCDGVDDATDQFCSDDTSTPGIDGILETALNILSIVAGVAAVIMFMLGGAKYITSQGDPSSTTQARNTLIYAAIGLVIVIAAQALVTFAINSAANDAPPTSVPCTGNGPC